MTKENSAQFSHVPSYWDDECLFDSAEEYFGGVLHDISCAEKNIELAVYIFALDQVGLQFVDALTAASQRGVAVRVIMDGAGSSDDSVEICDRLVGSGVDAKIYHPLPWDILHYRWSLISGTLGKKFTHFTKSLNRRDHRKFCVIDEHIAWCGNLNLCEDHLGVKEPWRDYAARVTGTNVNCLINNFDVLWGNKEWVLNREAMQWCCENVSFKARRVRNRQLLSRIRQAREKVWICSAYFSPTNSVMRAIRLACKRGVDVRLIVAGRSDIKVFPLLSSTYSADLLVSGANVYEYQAGILHAKVILVDDHCIVGSTNLNHRSFYHDLELDVVLSRSLSIERAKMFLEQDMQHSRPVEWRDVSLLSRSFWFGWLPRLFRHWM